MSLPKEKDTFSAKNLGDGYFVELASYTASGDQMMFARVRFDALAGDDEYEVRFAITPDGGSERECVGAAWSMRDTAEGRYVHSCEIFLEDGDVIKCYAKNLSASGDASVAGEVCWINKTPLQPTTHGRNLDVAADGVAEANMVQINGGATDGHNASLKLKNLLVETSDASDVAVRFEGKGAGSTGFHCKGLSYGQKSEGCVVGNHNLSDSGAGQKNEGAAQGQYNRGTNADIGDGVYSRGGRYGSYFYGGNTGFYIYGPVYGMQLDSQEIGFYIAAHLVGMQIQGTNADVLLSTTGKIHGSLSGDVQGNVVGDVGGAVVGAIGSLAPQAKADVNAEADQALTDYDPPTNTEMAAAHATTESNIRGGDSDDLKTISDQIDTVKAKTDQIGSVEVTYTSPADTSGSFVIYGGNNYLAADGRNLPATIHDYSGPDLTAASAKFRILEADDYKADVVAAALEVDASVSVNGSDVVLSADLTDEQTAALQPAPPDDHRNYVFQYIVTATGGAVATLAAGRLTCKKGIAEVAAP